MAIHFQCECGKALSAGEEFAGKRARCKACGQVVRIPEPQPQGAPTTQGSWGSKRSLMEITQDSLRKEIASIPVAHRTLRDYAYLVFLLAMLPLAASLFTPDGDLGRRVERSLSRSTADTRLLLEEIRDELGPGTLPDWIAYALPSWVFSGLDGRRIEGAMLARDSFAHWPLAALSAAGFLVLIALLFPRDRTRWPHLLAVGLFTATVGIALLFLVQALAEATRGQVMVGGGPVALIFWLLKIIGGSYDAAFDPDANLLVSWFGFTVSVGFLEEYCKAIPLIWLFRRGGMLGWRSACAWGLASGVGFGVVEGIMYSGDYYNGIHSAGAYLTRFLSCVALHAVWAGSAGIFMFQQRKMLARKERIMGYLWAVVGLLVLSIFLHGTYDTLLKKDHNLLALLTALATFTVLALQIEHMRRQETPDPKRLAKAYGLA